MDKEQEILKLEKAIAINCRCFFIDNYKQEDLRQEMRLLLWEKLDQYDPKYGSIANFAITIMRRRLIDMIRRSKAQKRNTSVLRIISIGDIDEIPEIND